MIRGIYHPELKDYPYCQSFGFSHVQIGQDWPQNHDYLVHAINAAHEVGLHAILEPLFTIQNKNIDTGVVWNRAMDLLRSASKELCKECVVLLDDEPNVRGIAPSVMIFEHKAVKDLVPQCKTMIVLGWTHSYGEYDAISDILGFDYYGKDLSDLWSFLALPLRIKVMMHRHRTWNGDDAEFVAVPAIRKSPAHIRRQMLFWKLLGIKNFLWYDWTGDGGKWFQRGLTSRRDLCGTLKEINEV